MTSSAHSAEHSALGFYHQGLFALVELLDSDDHGSVSVETADDVVRHEAITSLNQLKHSMGTPRPLTLKNDGFWNTLGIWAGGPFDGTLKFVFVTCADIAAGSELACLAIAKSNRDTLKNLLDDEATRVMSERAAAKAVGKPQSYAERAAGCEAYLRLSPNDRKRFVDLITIVPNSFTAAAAPEEVAKRLNSVLHPSVRDQVVERLIEWWDRQVVLSLLSRRPRQLHKAELQNRLHELLVEHSPQSLPDDFGSRIPESIEAETGKIMAKQIEWVQGGKERLRRAVIARWRARSQRGKWLDKDVSIATELDRFDETLIEVWQARHGPMVDDCNGYAAKERRAKGLTILDWSHHDAHRDLPPFRPNWTHAYLVQGILQQLADQERIGWHPDFEALLKELKETAQ